MAEKRSAELIYSESAAERKSHFMYKNEWQRFLDYSGFQNEFSLDSITEQGIVQYLDYLRKELNLAPTTIWSSFSKLNTMYQDFGGQKLQVKYPRLIKLLQRYQHGYTPKRAEIFTVEQIESFLKNSPEEGQNLLNKSVVCFGFYGGLRCADMVGICNEDVEVDSTNGLWVKYSVSKTSGMFHKTNTFLVPKPHDTHVMNYLNATNKEGRIFKNFNNKFTAQPMGVRTIAKVPNAVATFLGIFGNYTGHCFRRSCATVLAENGATSVQLKNLMNWRSESTALNYVQNTKRARIQVNALLNTRLPENVESERIDHKHSIGPDMRGANFTNCVFHFG
jgi:integrase